MDTDHIARIIDEHRVVHNWSGKYGRTTDCLCGHTSQFRYEDQDGPIDGENNPERATQRAHAQHVAEVLKSYQVHTEGARNGGPLGSYVRTVPRARSTKYQVAKEIPRDDEEHLVTADLLRDAASTIARTGEVPARILIDTLYTPYPERITLTWFA